MIFLESEKSFPTKYLLTPHVSVENENVSEIVYDDKPDIIGVSINVDSLARATEIAQAFRMQGIPVVAGGILVTTAKDFIQDDSFDVLCIGAAEGTWPRIIQDAETGELKKEYKCPHDFIGENIVSPAYDMMRQDFNSSQDLSLIFITCKY